MKRIVFVGMLAFVGPALAQVPVQIDAKSQALGQEIGECMNGKITLRMQIVDDQKKIAELEAQLTAAKASADKAK